MLGIKLHPSIIY